MALGPLEGYQIEYNGRAFPSDYNNNLHKVQCMCLVYSVGAWYDRLKSPKPRQSD